MTGLKRRGVGRRNPSFPSAVLRHWAFAFLLPLLMALIILSPLPDEGHAQGRQQAAPQAYHDGRADGRSPLVSALVVGVILGALVFRVRRTLKLWYRKGWQENATEEEPPGTCQPCTRHCRKVEIEPPRRRLAYISLACHDPDSGSPIQVRQTSGAVVDGLNRVVSMYRRGERSENLHDRLAPLAEILLQRAAEGLGKAPGARDVAFTGHLRGFRVRVQFILFHCQDTGISNAWVEEDRWRTRVKDERDEPIGTLHRFDPAEPWMPERWAPEMTRLLLRFIERL